MGSRFPSHQLSNGLYVSGRREAYKERQATMTSTAMPYTGGDIKKSGELGKMFDINMNADHPHSTKSKKSGPLTGAAPARSGSFGAAHVQAAPASSYSGPLPSSNNNNNNSSNANSATTSSKLGHRTSSNSGPVLSRNLDSASLKKTSGPQRHNSGPLPPPPAAIPATGLITSGPLNSRKASGPIGQEPISVPSSSVASKTLQCVTNLSHQDVAGEYSCTRNLPRVIVWTVIPLFLIGLIAAVFILVAVRNAILLIVVMAFFWVVALLLAWNSWWGNRAITGFVSGFPDAELRTARDGQYVKISGVVTCGNVPLETSYQRVPRCVYTSTGLYEYRGCASKPANPTHRRFTWGLRYLERRVVDFYISDFQSGLRALVKAGSGARVTPHVEESTVIDINKNNRNVPPNFVRWLADRNLSSDDRVMCLKEGYVREGSTVSVMGIVQRNDNVLMIVPPSEPVSTGCQWMKCLLPASLEGIILKCEDKSKGDAIPV